jgi:transcriptional regulator with XRE-family HTH domain
MAATDLKRLLGATIRSERSALGISQEELAYRAGLHRTYISDVERGLFLRPARARQLKSFCL